MIFVYHLDSIKDGKIDDQQWGVKSTGNHDSAHSSNVVRDNGLHLNFAKKQSASFQYSGAHVQSRFQNLGWFIMQHIKRRLGAASERIFQNLSKQVLNSRIK